MTGSSVVHQPKPVGELTAEAGESQPVWVGIEKTHWGSAARLRRRYLGRQQPDETRGLRRRRKRRVARLLWSVDTSACLEEYKDGTATNFQKVAEEIH